MSDTSNFEVMDNFLVYDVPQLLRQHPELVYAAIAALFQQEGMQFIGTTIKKGIVMSTTYHIAGGRP